MSSKCMKNEMEKIQEEFDFWKSNPVDFIKSIWPNLKLWGKLEEICNSVRDNRLTVVPSCHGAGKSFISARIAVWWLFTHYPSKVITTAPTWNQVESVLWGELRSAVQSSRISLCNKEDLLNTEIKLAPDWFAKGLSTTEGVDQREYGSTKFQGFHSPNLLVILDEAPGVHKSIHIAVETLATGENNRILEIGNPTSPSGPFYDNCYSKNAHKIQISANDHPNIKENKEIIPGAITKEWVERMKQEWGEGSPLYKAKVLGEFPDETEDTLIPLSWCEKAVNAEIKPSQVRVLGVDPARFGDDKSVGYELIGNIARLKFEVSKEDTQRLAGRIVNCIEDYDEVDIDGTGVGGGVVDGARAQFRDDLDPNRRKLANKIREIHFGSKALNETRFFNLRAEMYWNLRERLRSDAPDWMKIKIPDDDELKSQLSSLKFYYSTNGRIQMEEKDEVKKRIGKSPDKADALALVTWAARVEKPEQIIQNPVYKEFFEMKRKKMPRIANRF
jgi:phage terminase large subunit